MHERAHLPSARRSEAVAARVSPPAPAPQVQALLALQRSCGNRHVQRVAAAYREGGTAPASLERHIDAARSGGRPLEPGLRERMESAFATDLGAVRVHTGNGADELNRAVSARAFTTGSDVFFANGEYSPGSAAGRELIAHELTHVLQQSGGLQAKLHVTAPGGADEREADAVAREIVRRESEPREAGE